MSGWVLLFMFLAGLVLGMLIGALFAAMHEVKFQRDLEAHVEQQLRRSRTYRG